MTQGGARSAVLSPEAAIAEEAMRGLQRAQRAQQLYGPNSAARAAAQEAARAALLSAWEIADPLVFLVRRDALLFNEESVLVESARAGDGLAWLLFREGIREIRLTRGFEQAEMETVLEILARARTATIDNDDLVTMLWLANLTFFTYRHVEVVLEAGDGRDEGASGAGEFASAFGQGGEWAGLAQGDDRWGRGGVGGVGGGGGGAPGEGGAGDAAGGGSPRRAPPGSVEEEIPGFLDMMPPPLAREPDDDVPLVLEPEELSHLEVLMAREARENQQASVRTALLEIAEMEVAEASRLDAVAALERLFVEQLGSGDYQGASELLAEVDELLGRSNLEATVAGALGRIADRVSTPGVLRPLLQLLADPRRALSDRVIDRLFADIRPEALPTLAPWLRGAAMSPARARVEKMAVQLAEAYPLQLAATLAADDAETLLGGLTLASRFLRPELAPALCRAARHADADVRLAAVGLLAGLDGPEVRAAVAQACVDPARPVRMVGYKAVAAGRLEAAQPLLLRQVATRAFEPYDFNERFALFDALGSVAGDEAVILLERLLNARGLLGPKEPADLRACAARALGRARGTSARRALERAADTREPLVQRAVRLALTGEGLA